MHRVLLLGEGPVREIPVWHGSAQIWPACLTPASPVTDIFVLTGDISGQGQGRTHAGRHGRTQDPEGWLRWGYGSRGETQVRNGSESWQGGGGKGSVGGDRDDVVGKEQERNKY